MNTTPSDIRASKFLSLTLRHKPAAAGLTLDDEGWAEIEALIAGAPMRLKLTREALERIVAENDKKRFQISQDGRRVRAVQGHSQKVDLKLEPVAPPAQLFHGTATRFLKSILKDGLRPGNRSHVHLSPDQATATKVGSRHGLPVVLEIDAIQAHVAGQPFYRAENGVWLTAPLAPRYLRRLESR